MTMFRFGFLSLVLAFAALSPTAVANDSLIGRWGFDDFSGGVIKDSAGRFDASVSRDLPLVDGVIGKGVELSGNYKISISPDFLPSGITEVTISAWVAPKSLSGYREIFRKEDSSAGGGNSETKRILFSFQDNGRFLTLGLNTGGNYAECDALISPSEIVDNKWHFAVGTFDGLCMRVFLDGREIGSYLRQSCLSTAADFRPFNKNRDAVARAQYDTLESVTVNAPAFIGSSDGSSEFFEGKMDDVRFYAKALSPDEIQSLYQQGGGNVVKPLSDDSITKYYVKRETYNATLLATREKLETLIKETEQNSNKSGEMKFDVYSKVVLHRLIRNDFPNEVNDCAVKYQRSPVDWLMSNAEQLKTRTEQLRVAYNEYLPITETQWKLLNNDERVKWNRVKEFSDKLSLTNLTGLQLYEIVLDMENVVEERPYTAESVARYRTPSTPPVKDRTEAESQAIIENEWLFQSGDKPTVERSLQEITWTRELAARISRQYTNVTFTNELKEIASLEQQAKELAAANDGNGRDSENRELYFAVRKIKRAITFKNPVIDFDSLMFVDSPMPDGGEWRHETRHRLGYMAVPGGRLMTLKGLSPAGHQTKLMPQEPLHGSFWRPDLSYDARRVLVGFKPHNEKNFHIYEINVDGSGSRQLTAGIFDDFDPVYLPDGKNIMFLTTRGHIYVRCMPPTNAFVMARMSLDTKPGDKSLYLISRNGEPEYTPSVMNDGRVIFTRWEYTDKPLWRAQSLWTMNADGSQVQTFWGNQSVWPDLLKDARSIPGSERVMFTGSAHHNWFSGSVGIIDPAKGLNFPDGLTKVTQEVVWPECGNGAVDPKETDVYHTAGHYGSYYSPYPLNENDFLVSAQRIIKGDDGKLREQKFVLLLMDTNGNRELVFEGDNHILDAQPLRPRTKPPVSPDRVEWPSYEDRDNPQTGVIYSNNVYENMPEEIRGKAKFLRIWSIEHKTYTYWYKRNYVSSGPEISANQSEGVKKIIGTVPIEADGSVSFRAPSGIALHFQLLDENQLALQTMKSFTGVLPGETRGCLGCHESHIRTAVTARTGKALTRAPSDITPVAWDDITVGYERYVQPTLDKYCGKCHEDPNHDAYKKFNATLRPGFLGFKEPYMTLMGSPTWGSPYKQRDADKPIGGFGWADTILVESYSTLDPAAYKTYPPMTKLSYKSRLIHRMMSGEHNGVKVSGEDLLRVILWVDAMGPYYGTEEVRQMEDPI
ncbi:MAG: hypothetical protein LBU65_04360, partial [Planctomycetaceae bacterium]|nr:hypothetical protein [Planctomycetaceae bacterium]